MCAPVEGATKMAETSDWLPPTFSESTVVMPVLLKALGSPVAVAEKVAVLPEMAEPLIGWLVIDGVTGMTTVRVA